MYPQKNHAENQHNPVSFLGDIRISTLSPGFLSQKTRKSLRLCAFA